MIPIWLIALAHSGQANGGRPVLPRRLVYIVNRRTVVDQATEDAEHVLRLLREPQANADALRKLHSALATIAGDNTEVPLAVSTLRGELADNGEWRVNPARPAIIIGTIDMIGSKLLFSGYGDGRYGRAHHVGLIGQDTLIVHDEAHLSPAFSALLRSVEQVQRRCGEMKRIRVLELSATTRGVPPTNGAFALNTEDDEDLIVNQRRTARKRITLKPCGAGKGELAKTIADTALTYREAKARVLIYIRSPENAKAIADTLKDKKKGLGDGADNRVCLLTGTIRGHERDQLAKSKLFKAFKADPNRPQLEQTLYLVSTSAGEVGVDFDADHLVCDLTTLDSMAQRFGRVNRLGGDSRKAEITVVCEQPKPAAGGRKGKKPSPLGDAIAKTGEILRRIEENGGDVSPAALVPILQSDDAPPAYSPAPTILPATDILFDSWALTSIAGDLTGRPEVGPYLHGVAEWEPPETYVAWRADIDQLASASVSDGDLTEMLDVFPVRTAERLKDRSDRVQQQLAAIATRHDGVKAILIRNGEPRWIKMSQLAPADKKDRVGLSEAQRLLSYATVLLPTKVGGLKNGTLDGKSEVPVTDVAELPIVGQRARQRVRVTGEEAQALLGGSVDGNLVARCSVPLRGSSSEDEDALPVKIEYRVARAESNEPGQNVPLANHALAVEAATRRIARAHALAPGIAEALTLAGHWHDRGKDRVVWQRFARNANGSEPLAKSKKYLHGRILGGYRHEFGSLLDAAADDSIKNHLERDLILHLIAAHHGWARPHFRHDASASAHDQTHTTSENQRFAVEVMQRFGQLQQRFGRWGLAWLESLLRCADALASAQAQEGESA